MPTMIVETGDHNPNANSYCDLAFADAFHEMLGNTDWAGDDATKEAALIKATWSIDLLYGEYFQSIKSTQLQALQFPRLSFVDLNGQIQVDGAVPVELKRAVASHALKLMFGEVEAVAQESTTSNVKGQKLKVDVIEIDNQFFGEQASARYSGYDEVELLLRPLMKKSAKAGGRTSGSFSLIR